MNPVFSIAILLMTGCRPQNPPHQMLYYSQVKGRSYDTLIDYFKMYLSLRPTFILRLTSLDAVRFTLK